jgi:hypothetical protein
MLFVLCFLIHLASILQVLYIPTTKHDNKKFREKKTRQNFEPEIPAEKVKVHFCGKIAAPGSLKIRA